MKSVMNLGKNMKGRTNMINTENRGPDCARKRTQASAIGAVLVALALALCVLCTSGCAPAKSDGAKELKAGSTTYFFAESMDPASEWDSWYLSYYGIVENLFRVSDDLTSEPWLAESATSPDGKTWTVKIKDGITFSNGEAVDAAAVKAAWERTYAENSRGTETLAIEMPLR